MKKEKMDLEPIICGATLIAAGAFLLGTCLGTKQTERDLYPLPTVVTEIDRSIDKVTVTDYTGYEWSFYGCEDWQLNDICTLLMDTRKTEKIYDDRIVQTRYSGSVESMVDMEAVTDFQANDDSLYLYLADGTGYYWER
jgi:hypothetical protein